METKKVTVQLYVNSVFTTRVNESTACHSLSASAISHATIKRPLLGKKEAFIFLCFFFRFLGAAFRIPSSGACCSAVYVKAVVVAGNFLKKICLPVHTAKENFLMRIFSRTLPP